MPARTTHRHGLTLIELLVVISIVMALLALTLPAIVKVREAARNSHCKSNLRQIAIACTSFDSVHGTLPPAFGFYPQDSINGAAALGPAWFHLLPVIEADEIYQDSWFAPTPDVHYYSYQENGVDQTTIPLFNCPSDFSMPVGLDKTRRAASSYAFNYLCFGVTDEDWISVTPLGAASLNYSFTDGLSNTILIVEKYANASMAAADNPSGIAFEGGTHWPYLQADCSSAFALYHCVIGGQQFTDPNSVGPGSLFQVRPPVDRNNPCLASTPHSAMNAALADCSVHALSGDMDPEVWWALCTPNGGEPVTVSW